MTQYSDLPFYEKLFILQRLPHDKFKLLCTADRQMTPVCMGNLTQDIITKHGSKVTEELYQGRSNNMFNSSLLQFKTNNMSWKEFYERVNRLIDNLEIIPDQINMNTYLINSRILEAKILYQIRDVDIEFRLIVLLLSAEGPPLELKLEFLEWLKEIEFNFPVFPLFDQDILNNIEVVKWLLENKIFPHPMQFLGLLKLKYPYTELFEVLDLFASYGYYPDQIAANTANSVEMVKWLYNHQPNTPLPNQDALDDYLADGRVDILEFWNNNIRTLTQQDLNGILQYASEVNLIPYEELNIIRTLNWFESKGILPIDLDQQIRQSLQGYETISDWLTKRNL